MKYDPDRHHRKSIRLPGFDYARSGAYFVTICTREKYPFFGQITDGAMRLNRCGEIARASWVDLPNHYPQVELDEWVVMPNHFHGIIILVSTVGAGFKPAHSTPRANTRAGLKPAPTTWHGLPEIVRGFKTFSSRRVNRLRQTPGLPLWQRNYYEHVIRDEDDLNRVREYIVSNPLKWEFDRENPDCINSVGAGFKPAPTKWSNA